MRSSSEKRVRAPRRANGTRPAGYDDEEEEDKEQDGAEDGQVEEEPLNSEDDVSDEEGQELFDTENVVVCQYDKVRI